MKNKNTFELLKKFIYSFPEGETFTRQELIGYVYGSETKFISGTIDNYRNQLTKCQYIISIGRGVFRKVKELPENMTSSMLEKEYKIAIEEERLNNF